MAEKAADSISRRAAMRGAGMASVMAGLSGCADRAGAADTRALAIIGDRYHNSDYIRTALTRTLVEGVGQQIQFTDNVEALSAENLRDRKLLIILRDGFVWPDGYPDQDTYPGYVGGGRPEIVSVPPLPETEAEQKGFITPEQGRAVKEFVQNGGGALLLHNVTYIAPFNEDFRDVLGAVTEGHPPIRPFKVEVVNKEQPITQGLDDFVVTDEQHYMVYEKEPEHIILRSVNQDGLTYKELGTSCEAGWAYDYGEGRVWYLAPGHMIVNLWNPTYVKIQQNACRWVQRQI